MQIFIVYQLCILIDSDYEILIKSPLPSFLLISLPLSLRKRAATCSTHPHVRSIDVAFSSKRFISLYIVADQFQVHVGYSLLAKGLIYMYRANRVHLLSALKQSTEQMENLCKSAEPRGFSSVEMYNLDENSHAILCDSARSLSLGMRGIYSLPRFGINVNIFMYTSFFLDNTVYTMRYILHVHVQRI